MNTRLNRPVQAGQLCRELGLVMSGPDREIRAVGGLDSLDEHSLAFVRDREPAPAATGTVFARAPLDGRALSVIVSASPRLDFIRAQHLLRASPGFVEDAAPPELHPTVVVGRGAVVENGVRIGEGTRIGSGAVVKSGTLIGRFCEIEAGAVVGATGFGFETGADGHPIKMLQLGGLRIGDHVEIGSLTTVCRGALGDTVVEDHVKIADHVHIGHNCRIGAGTMITACAEVSGSVTIGKKAWLAPNCSIMQKVILGDGCFIGIGAVVLRGVPAGAKMFGNPAMRVVVPSVTA
ncbi:MAG: UDP-3-O-(3-hydroxymyristoyl)glucosamine N-acyltransferase [Elusimicrobia bacterium]|nr:UDP-3-O-(3-hydroxymyristoyl)glucosamine N-acyltransferase [Elusimicrobiota bacterium]